MAINDQYGVLASAKRFNRWLIDTHVIDFAESNFDGFSVFSASLNQQIA